MADPTLSDEEIVNPIETAVSRGASLVEPEKASISRKRKVIVNSGQYKASREYKNPNPKSDTTIIKESSRCVISSFSLLVDPDCESVVTLLIVITRKHQLARFVNQVVTLTV